MSIRSTRTNAPFADTLSRSRNQGTNPSGSFSATGGTTYTPGNGYKYHMFTYPNSQDFVVTGASKNIDILVVAGGGGGGGGSDSTWTLGGGGGAGGITYGTNLPIAPGTYPVTVGAGGPAGAGAPGSSSAGNGTSGGNSFFGSPGTPIFGQPNYVLAKGGGYGGGGFQPFPTSAVPGGSGGGYGYCPPPAGGSTSATQPGTNPALTDFGSAGGAVATSGQAAGGGGAAGTGGSAPGSAGGTSGPGGAGGAFPVFAAPLFPGMPSPWTATVGPTGLYGGGGGGGSSFPGGNDGAGTGGPGGGAPGGPINANATTTGVDGTGGGGGGGGGYAPRGYDGSRGGHGIVIVRYLV